MSYLAQDQLARDPDFQARVRACAYQQAEQNFGTSTNADEAALAGAVVRGEGPQHLALFNMCAASPGLADKAELPNGGVDSSTIADEEVLASVQAFWPDVARAFYETDGTPKASSGG